MAPPADSGDSNFKVCIATRSPSATVICKRTRFSNTSAIRAYGIAEQDCRRTARTKSSAKIVAVQEGAWPVHNPFCRVTGNRHAMQQNLPVKQSNKTYLAESSERMVGQVITSSANRPEKRLAGSRNVPCSATCTPHARRGTGGYRTFMTLRPATPAVSEQIFTCLPSLYLSHWPLFLLVGRDQGSHRWHPTEVETLRFFYLQSSFVLEPLELQCSKSGRPSRLDRV
jgi:hypothetical protein